MANELHTNQVIDMSQTQSPVATKYLVSNVSSTARPITIIIQNAEFYKHVLILTSNTLVFLPVFPSHLQLQERHQFYQQEQYYHKKI